MMLDLQGVTVEFAGRTILNDINITFHQGEMIGLVAPNGTGKSTLMNVIMNYLKPTRGKVLFRDGLSYSSKSNEVEIHQIVSMMPDQSDLYNHLSGREHLKMYAMMWKSNPKRINETIEALNMGHYVDKKTGSYSLGMRQRLCFAMQIVSDTEIMLMDEVMNGLDPNNVEIISKMLMKKKEEGKMIMIASHLLDNLEQYADRIFLFKQGKLINTDEIVADFSQSTLNTLRVKNMPTELKMAMQEDYPAFKMETLVNGMTLVAIDQLDGESLGSLTADLVRWNVHEFTFGQVTLNDLYAMYYHEIV